MSTSRQELVRRLNAMRANNDTADAAKYLAQSRSANEKNPLTEKQAAFVKHYVENGLSAQEAARRAGYSVTGDTAIQMLSHPGITNAVKARQAEFQVVSQVTKKMVIDGFLEAIEMAKMKEEPMTAVAGWREIGRMCGMYEPQRTEVTVNTTGKALTDKLATMSDAELQQFAAEPLVLDVDFTEVPDDGGKGQ